VFDDRTETMHIKKAACFRRLFKIKLESLGGAQIFVLWEAYRYFRRVFFLLHLPHCLGDCQRDTHGNNGPDTQHCQHGFLLNLTE
jgi:hypothetical protein